MDYRPQSIDDLALYSLFTAELLQLMRTYIHPGKQARVATAIVVKAVARPPAEPLSPAPTRATGNNGQPASGGILR